MIKQESKSGALFIYLFGGFFVVMGAFGVLMSLDAWFNLPFIPFGDNATGDIWVGVVVGGVFCIVGGGIIWLAHRASRMTSSEQELKQRYPGQPWRWDEDWASGSIPSTTSMGAGFLVWFASLWLLMSAPIPFMLTKEVSRGNYTSLLALIFPLVGIGLLLYAIKLIRSVRQYGISRLVLDHQTGVIGAKLSGHIEIPAAVRFPDGIDIQLICKQTRGSGKSRNDELIWTDSIRVASSAIDMLGNSTHIPVHFDLPADVPATTSDTQPIKWNLQVGDKRLDPDYMATFNVPVFDVPGFQHVSQKGPSRKRQADLVDTRDEMSGVIRNPGLAKIDWDFPASRNRGHALFMLLFSMAFLSVGVFLLTEGEFFIAFFFILIPLLLLIPGIRYLLFRSRIQVSGNELVLESGHLGIKEKRFSRDMIQNFSTESIMSSGNTRYFRMLLHDHRDKKHLLANGIKGERAANLLLDEIKSALSWQPPPGQVHPDA